MNKAILIIDMPEECIECPLCKKSETTAIGVFEYRQLYVCGKEPEDIENGCLNDNLFSKPDWCPLREMPKKKGPSKTSISPIIKEYYTEYDRGYNDCIDDILGDVGNKNNCSECSRRKWYQKGYADAERDNGWIPVSVRLPEEFAEVLVTIKETEREAYVRTSWLQEKQWIVKKNVLHPKVIAWKPMPEPYQEGSAE